MVTKSNYVNKYDGNGYFVNKTVTPSSLYTLAVPSVPFVNTLYKGKKQYELSNHLGNVLVTISDRKIAVDDNADLIIDYYNPDILSLSDYYAFGSAMPGRSLSVKGYRYGFNGETKEDDISGEAMVYDLGARFYDSRLGRMFSLDPLMSDYPWQSPYAYCYNNPIYIIDMDGMGGGLFNKQGEVKSGEGLYSFCERYGIQGNSTLEKYETIAKLNPTVFLEYESWSQGKTDQEKLDYFNSKYKNYRLYANMKLNIPESVKSIRPFEITYGGFESHYEHGYMDGDINSIVYYTLKQTSSNEVKSSNTCQKCLDPKTVGHNFFGLSYPGPWNPKSFDEEYSYSHVPTNRAEFPAIGHDRRYDNLGVEGASGLLFVERAIGADWLFVKEEFSLANPSRYSPNFFVSPKEKLTAFTLGTMLAIPATIKTSWYFIKNQYNPNAVPNLIMWFYISDSGVDNNPTIHKH